MFFSGRGATERKSLALDKKAVVWYSISVTKASLCPFFGFLCVFAVFFCRIMPEKCVKKCVILP